MMQKSMKEFFSAKDFDETIITCPHCNWKGLGSETNIIDLYGISKLREVHCPNCDNFIAGLERESDHGNPEGDELSNQLG
ncbi:hypothetical protein OCK74_03770 [Chitinophagaceae bacterium LB-8]|uniref:Uncharacterized protein n=1 Tax=Paraflavisolibacter caeni TaxID=2982496 RepID=A0A9X3BF46_9BACT|nr:hypothetical protein [Paraflavisolibacter caeni]MCU7548214.1 hypothetical protein [Paraflavisolibacter caeni]